MPILIRRLSAALGWLAIVAIVISTVSPIGLRPVTGLPPDYERFAAYALVAGAFALAYPRRWLACLAVAVIGAGLLEVGQLLAASRHARFHDFAVKASGAMVGAAFSIAANRMGRLWTERR